MVTVPKLFGQCVLEGAGVALVSIESLTYSTIIA